MIYSVFETEHFKFYGRDQNDIAINKPAKQLAFYNGDLSDIATATDDRFKETKGRRNQAIFMGLTSNVQFPIKYPFKLDNGIILDGYAELDYNENEDDPRVF